MCGIAGIITHDTDNVSIIAALQHMSEKLRHRGPDDEGFLLSNGSQHFFYSGNDTPPQVRVCKLKYTGEQHISTASGVFSIGFCHRRLSILDLSPRGHQPMCDEEKKIHLTYNGEIYNYLELRQELSTKGFQFFTETDTEVIINAYKCWGRDCLSRFNGMWSFVLFDAERQELFAARDRFGVKPLYYYHDTQNFCFASEIKALSGLPFVKTGINEQALCDFLLNNELEYSPEGLFSNIFELFPSRFLVLDLRTFQIQVQQYFQLEVSENNDTQIGESRAQIIARISELLQSAVRLRLRSDVPVGACVSGGIDSAVIAGIMLKQLDPGIVPEFFSAVFPGSSVDESGWAEQVVRRGGNWNRVHPLASDLWNDLDELIYAQDTPLWSSSTYAQHRVMQLAKERNIKVLLDGQGGDELFAGYIPHFLSYWNELSLTGRRAERSREMKQFAGAKKFIAKETIKEKIDHSGLLALKKIKDPLLKVLKHDFLAAYHRSPKTHRKYDQLNQHLQAEFCDTRLKLYLKCEDRCSMWHSVESRTPFADDRQLITYLFQIPGYLKIKNGTTKVLLREAGKEFLPDKIYQRRDKMGYLTPHNVWMSQLFSQVAQEDFSEISHYLNKEVFLKNKSALFNPAGSGENFLAFKILTLNRWRRLFKR